MEGADRVSMELILAGLDMRVGQNARMQGESCN